MQRKSLKINKINMKKKINISSEIYSEDTRKSYRETANWFIYKLIIYI